METKTGNSRRKVKFMHRKIHYHYFSSLFNLPDTLKKLNSNSDFIFSTYPTTSPMTTKQFLISV